jgi:hypothetical protein
MPADPKIVLDESVMRYALAAPSKLRSRLVANLEQLQRSPAEPPDFREQNATGRRLSIKVMRPFLITYWLDGPVNELRIVDVQTVR